MTKRTRTKSYNNGKRYGECSETIVFLRKIGRETVQIVEKTTAVLLIYYGFERRSISSMEESSGMA